MLESRLQEEKQKELRRDIIKIFLHYFAEEEGINILFDDTTVIGLRLSFYFPAQCKYTRCLMQETALTESEENVLAETIVQKEIKM